MKSRKVSHDVLYVPIYLRILSFREKALLATLVVISSVAMSLIPIIGAATHAIEPTTSPIYSGEAELWRVLGEKD
ncbi:hypothetical protein S7335_2618 [Synechococcus sp. PCC 7335]|uniref:hypothetical protein n=1 Tax=Synechococcus sp. (strain ATCC 29403 / PCC 7335) TaxID=91464 RepID=UPI00017ED946|nr:hypothetical protein [Synechococcus sp. PCC 7335]EDX84919.1 hypothetical protein S7335_2618 [Synechococcus sp. PCC 7335]